MGNLRWLNGEPAAAEQLLVESIEQLDGLGLSVEAARARVRLGRCRWELDRPDEALQDYELARRVLDDEGPSAGSRDCLSEDRRRPRLPARLRAVPSRGRARRDHRRAGRCGLRAGLGSLASRALGYFGTAEEYAILDACYQEAVEKGYGIIAGSVVYNEVWDRVHALTGGLDGPLDKLDRMPLEPRMLSGGTIAKSLALAGPRRTHGPRSRRRGGRPRDTRVSARASSPGGPSWSRRRRCSSSGGPPRPRLSFLLHPRGTSSRTSSTTRRRGWESRWRSATSTRPSSSVGERQTTTRS